MGEDILFPDLSVRDSPLDPAMMDFLLLTQVVMVVVMDFLVLTKVFIVVVIDFLVLTQANHTIYDYGSFGFWGAVLAGGTTMLADGYRFASVSYYFSVAC